MNHLRASSISPSVPPLSPSPPLSIYSLHLSLCPSTLSISPSVPPLSPSLPLSFRSLHLSLCPSALSLTQPLSYVHCQLHLRTCIHKSYTFTQICTHTLTPHSLTLSLHSPLTPSPFTHPHSRPHPSLTPFHHTLTPNLLTPHSHSPPRQMTPATDGTPPVKTPWTGPASQPGQLAEQAPAGTCHQEGARG